MAEHFPPTPSRRTSAGLADQIDKGATVHDAVGLALGNVTDIDSERQLMIVDGRPVGYSTFEVPLSAVSEVTGNQVHLNLMMDNNATPAGTTPRFVRPPTNIQANSSPSPARGPAGATPFGASTTPTSMPSTPRVTPAVVGGGDPGYVATGAGASRMSGADDATGSTWNQHAFDDDDDDGTSTWIRLGLAGLTVTGAAAAGYYWWRRRQRRTTFEKAMDFATELFGDASGRLGNASGLMSDFLGDTSGYVSEASDFMAKRHPAWWVAAAASALPLLYYALPSRSSSSSDWASSRDSAADWARDWMSGAGQSSRRMAGRQLGAFDRFSRKEAQPRLKMLGRFSKQQSREPLGEIERLLALASALRASDVREFVADSMPSSLGPLDDLLANSRRSPWGTYGVPAAILLAGAIIFAATRTRRHSRSTRIGEVMTHRPQVIRPDATVSEAASVMRRLDVGAVPICDGSRLIGMLTDRDVAIRLAAEGRDPQLTRVRDIMSEHATWASVDDPVEEAARIMRQQQLRRLPVVDERHNLVGIVSLGDLATGVHDTRLSGQTLEDVSEPTGSSQSRL